MSAPSADVQRDVDGCRSAHARLFDTLSTLTDEQARSSSSLPDWSVGHVLTHLARNAEAFTGMIDGAERGEAVPMYPSMEARSEAIEAGAGRSAAELVADVREHVAQLEQRWVTMSERGWAGHGVTAGGPIPIVDIPGRRWREVEVHHTDLGLGVGFEDWPAEYVRVELVRMQMLWASRRPMGMTELPPEALAVAPAERLAWLFGRTTIPGLAPAGIF